MVLVCIPIRERERHVLYLRVIKLLVSKVDILVKLASRVSK